ncbi:hypothetical protein ZWY2020_000953 [Hordeum vulgare]|nr:hypothetical protein ZWY2020_000953 [Hordeum vulgare]
MELMMIKKHHMVLLALVMSIQHEWANGASITREWRNLVNSPALPPYEDVVGAAGPPTPAHDGQPSPPYCAYPPPANPTSPVAPSMPPPAGVPPPSTAPVVSPSPPANAPSSPHAAPPAGAPRAGGPTAVVGAPQGLWCVANPTVESLDVQAAMDYACGSGADCGMAAPGGPCYLPDTLMAHASFAFNSYWQRNKAAGGTCDFAGSAMLITKDPSYDECRYVYM